MSAETFPVIFLLYSTTSQGWLEWKVIMTKFVPVGLCLIAVMQWRFYRKQISDRTASHWEVKFYCALPLRAVSRWWGWLADKHIPESLRPLVYNLYIKTFGVDLSEAANQDLGSYRSLADFFSRPLKEGVREINQECPLVSPCDGTVLHFGPIETGHVEQVKGVTYSLENFLGENTWNNNRNHNEDCDYRKSLFHKPHLPNNLYHCVIYLAPGDYHRFHSPVDWQPNHRRHFCGQLLSVNPSIARWLPGLFCINERAVYLGHWEHGFFSMAAVGATNVGSVRVYFDKTLQTNRPKYRQPFINKDDKCLGTSINLNKGDLVGEFRMGSTIVLVFEAPDSFEFKLTPFQRVRVGEGIGCINKTKYVDRLSKTHTNTITIAT
ncbi:phosphatidylserine decarboxylase proenzyme, mitochondrial isoform X2 [Agrilus planipennis]|uniref:Phosphatidylserine decarboxylase proenzyme, mitochondrial n=1 Tax=Agrilus planipennis TaxID=224129 RepID=A0A7F5QVE2_AGRPL|nr:phosphatidylserine decarboxylase proenzyme, mitochondrial isoform X2 [Agrilus planipennis]